MLSAAAVLLHVAALGGVQWGWPATDLPLRPALAMQVRVLEPAAASAATVEAPVEALVEALVAERPLRPLHLTPAVVTAPPGRGRRAAPRTRPAEKAAEAPVAAQPVRDAPSPPPSPPSPPSPPPSPPPLAVVAEPSALPLQLALNAPAAAPPAGDAPIPHYRTRLPPAVTLRYEMNRGPLSGTGELAWRPDGDHYELTLKGSVGGLPVLTQVSRGGFDAEGVAPERFTDQRLRRGTLAANFQRAAGKATFSGPGTEVALQPGAQDRLSWMLQLAAIVAADPQHRKPGAKVVMQVIGAHGEAGLWSFRCVGPEVVESRSGAIDAIKFVREPREPYDTTVQVWLDPMRHDLPVRATQKSGPSDEGFELRLLDVVVSN